MRSASSLPRRRVSLALVALAALVATGGWAVFACTRTSASAAAHEGAWPVARVLFIGNSYTFVNDLPARVRALAASPESPVELEVDSVTVGSATLLDHVQKTGALEKIGRGGWSYVVIQGQSVESVYAPDGFERGARELAAKAVAVGAIPVFYETWARAVGADVYANAWSGRGPRAMQARIFAAYSKVARDTNARLVPAGQAWARALEEDPHAPLFAPDGSHPSAAGTYLAACVFYAVLTGSSPVGLAARPPSMSAQEAAGWQAIAWRTSADFLPDSGT